MKTNEAIIRQVLTNVFKKLTVNVSDFIDLYGFRTAEIKIGSFLLPIGIGFYEPSSSIKIFFIDGQCAKDDHQRFKPILEIGYRYWSDQEVKWHSEFKNTGAFTEVGCVRKLRLNMQAACEIIEAIEDEEQKMLNKT